MAQLLNRSKSNQCITNPKHSFNFLHPDLRLNFDSLQINTSRQYDKLSSSGLPSERQRSILLTNRSNRQSQLIETIVLYQSKNQKIEVQNDILIQKIRRRKNQQMTLVSKIKAMKDQIEQLKRKKSQQQKQLNIYAMNIKKQNTRDSMQINQTKSHSNNSQILDEIDKLNATFCKLFEQSVKCSAGQKQKIRIQMSKIAEQMKILRDMLVRIDSNYYHP